MSELAAVRLCVVGALGRMGRRLCALALEDRDFVLVSGLDAAVKASVDGEGLRIYGEPDLALRGVDLVIDFSAPAACALLAPLCAERHLPYVVGSTALGAAEERALAAASTAIPVLAAANFSLGVNVALELVELAAERLKTAFASEILELHHDQKRDAPSGTALALAEAVCRGRGELKTVVGRSGASAKRAPDEIGIAALRGGDVAGEHTVYFLGKGERLEISHRAVSPEILARGALCACRWLVSKSPGRYSMRDVLKSAYARSEA